MVALLTSSAFNRLGQYDSSPEACFALFFLWESKKF